MSIEVKNITKIYGQQRALDNISFKVETGEIVGFLGPNGAGKSTMMKILTGYIPQTEGNAKVCGLDIVTQSMEVRKLVGYLPESNPLYGDMYVKEYLRFVAGMHHLNGNKTALVDKMIEMTGLGLEQKKKIKTLSKGYKQRVGIAQALIHDPKVLILDEPTSGLDPNQLIDIRSLIINIGKEKTVMLSTHIMQEVKAVCKRVIIIDRGKIATDVDVANLDAVMPEEFQYFECEFDKPVSEAELKSIAGVTKAVHSGNNFWVIEAKKGDDIRPALSKWAVSKDLTILTMKKSETSLEEVFHKVTKKRN
jgi:ABC-2 type transport system ATP-binding protein